MNLDVQDIYSTNDAFAAIKSDGTIVAWGDGRNGGDSSAVQDTGAWNGSNLCPYASYVKLTLNTCAILFLSKYQIIVGTLSGGLHFVMSHSAFWRSFCSQLQSHEFSSCLSCISIFSCSSTSLSNTINTPWRQLEKELSPNYSQVTRQQRKVVTTTWKSQTLAHFQEQLCQIQQVAGVMWRWSSAGSLIQCL